MGTEVDTSNGEKQLNDFINEKRTIKFDIEPTKSAISNALKKIQSEFNEKKTPVYFDVAVRKSSINKAISDLRDEISKTKPITVNVVPKMDVDSSQFAGKNSIARIKNYIQSLLKDVDVKLTPKFDMKSITASIRNMKQELNKVAGEETEVKTNIVVNKTGNIGSPEALDSWLKSLRKFANFATKVPNGEINLKVNLGANIDAGFKQLIEGGFDLSKIKGGKLDINVNSGDSSTGVSSRRKGKSSKDSDLTKLDDLPTLKSGNDSKLKRAIDEMYKHISNKTSKTLEDAVEKATGISFKNTGANRDVHLQAAMAKLATQAQKLQLQGKTDDARALEDVITRISNELAKLKSDYAENGLFGSPSKNKLDRLQLMTTSDYHKQLDSDANARIEAGNRRRKQYQDSLKSDLKRSRDVLDNNNLASASKLIGNDIRSSGEGDYKEYLKMLKDYADNFHDFEKHEQESIRKAIKEYAEKRGKQIKTLLDNMKVRSEDFNKSIAQSYMKSLNSANDYAGVNSLDHGEKLENFAWMRDNMAGNYDSAAEHRRKAIEQRKQRLDPLQKEIDDLIVARNKGEKSTLGTNPELLNLINTKLRLMSEIGGADFGLKQQISYIKSLKNKNIDADAHGMLDKLLNQMVREFEEGYKGTVEGRIKYYNKQISDAFNKIKSKAGLGEDVTSDINRYMGFRSKLLEAQAEKSGGANADYSGASKGMLALSNIKGIDSKLLADIKQAEAEFRELAKAQSAAGDTAKKLSNEYEALKTKLNNVTSNGDISKIASKMDSNLMARFGRGDNVNRDIQALSQMATALNSRGLDGEPIAKLARKMQELSQQAKQVTQAEQQATKAQTTQNQAVIDAERELDRLEKKLKRITDAETYLSNKNPFSKQSIASKKATQEYERQLKVLYDLKRELGIIKTDGAAAMELMGKSTTFKSKFSSFGNSRIRSAYENVAGQFSRSEQGSRQRLSRTSMLENMFSWGTYGAKFLGRSAKGTGSALEASSMGIMDAFKLLQSSTTGLGKALGVAGIVISGFVGALAIGVEVSRTLFNVFEQLIGVVYRLLQPGIELYKQVTKATYSMGAAIASNAKFEGQQISLTTGIATSANLQRKAMLDAEKSVFDFSEIIQSLSGTLPILLGRGMSVDQAYRTNMGVASVAKLTNLAPNQVLQETRDLAQGTITARSSQVANALGISSADLQGKGADEIFNFFMDKFKNYENVLKRYAETPVGAFEQMMDRLRTVSMKFVEEIAYPFKELFNWITDYTGSWVDEEKRTLTRVQLGDGTTEQFWLKGGIDTKNDGAQFSIKEAMGMLDDDFTKLTDAIDRATKGSSTNEDNSVLGKFGLNSSDLSNKNPDDILDYLFGDITKEHGNTTFDFSAEFEKLKNSFMEIFKYLGSALDDIMTHIADTFGLDSATDAIDLFTNAIKLLIDATEEIVKITITWIYALISFLDIMEPAILLLAALGKIIWNTIEIFIEFANSIIILIGYIFEKLALGINKLVAWIADTFGISYDSSGNEARINKNLEYLSTKFDKTLLAIGGDVKDVSEAMFGEAKSITDGLKFSSKKIEDGLNNLQKQREKQDKQKGDAKDPKDLRGTPKNKVDEKALREARKAEKKAFDKYIAQLRDALEKHIQELKDALDKNEAAYKQGLKNYDAYVQDKLKFELEEQVAKREELQAEIEAIKTTGKYESEDEREKDLYEADKKLQSINREINKLTTTQNEVAGILNDGNLLLEQLVGLNRTANEKKNKDDNSNLTTKVETKETSLDVSGLLGLRNIDGLDDKKSWAMQYLMESGYASDDASNILAHALVNSADLSGNIFNFDSDTLNAYATQAGLNLANASDMFKASIAIATEKIKEAIPTDNSYTLDQFNAELKKLGLFIGDVDLSVMNDLVHSFKPFMKQITTTTHTLGNANNVVNQAVNGYKEWIDVREDGSGSGWMGDVTSNPSIQCDSWTGDVYAKSGINLGRSIVNDEDFRAKGLWHDNNGMSYSGTTPMADGYKAKPGDTIGWYNPDRDSWHYGIIIDDNKLMSRDSTGGLTTHTFDEARELFGPVLGIGEIGPLLGNVTNAITDVSEKITRGTTSTYTGEGLQAIEMKEKYLTTEFDLLAQLDKYEQNSFDTIDALSKSAEAIKKNIEAKYKILKTTGLNDEQQKRIISYEERLMLYQVQETMAKLIEEQANNYIENIEAQFNFDVASGGSRVDFSSIADKYDAIFIDMSTDVGRTIDNIKQSIKDADEAGNKAVAKSLRQTLNKFTTKLSEFFDKAEEAINKQYEYVESAMDNIGATDLQKEGMSRRFNIEKNRALAEMYTKQENIYENIYKNQLNDALDELHRNSELSAETLQKLADTETKLTQIHWAKQQAEELGEFKTQLEEANDVFKQALEDGLVDYMTEGVNAVLDGTKSIGDAFRELAVSILKTMQQFFAKRIIENLMDKMYPTKQQEQSIVDTANWQPKDIFNDPSRQQIYQQQMNNPELQHFMRDGYVIKNPVNDTTNAYDRGWRPEYEAVNPADLLAQKLTEASGAVENFKNSLTGEWQIRDEDDKKLYPNGDEQQKASTSVSNFAGTLDNASATLGTTLSTLQQGLENTSQNAGQVATSLANLDSKLSSFGLSGSGYAVGGYISGPGTSTSDSIPAMLSDGEFVVKASAVKRYGTNFLNAVNDGTFATIKPRHHFASGGLVTETAREATSTVVTELGRGIGTNINNEAHFNLVMASNQEDAMKAFMRSPEGQRIYLDMARKYASTTVRF